MRFPIPRTAPECRLTAEGEALPTAPRHAIPFHAPRPNSADDLAALARQVIGKRAFDFREHLVPDVLSRVERLLFLSGPEKALLTRIQARTYLRMFNALERAACDRALDVGRDMAFGHQSLLDALSGLADRKRGHYEIFDLVERMIAAGQPEGQEFLEPLAISQLLDKASTWAVFAVFCLLGSCAECHHLETDSPRAEHSSVFADAMRFHRPTNPIDASVEVMLWRREDVRLTGPERDRGVNDFNEMLKSLVEIALAQVTADALYFVRIVGRPLGSDCRDQLLLEIQLAYRWQYIGSGLNTSQFSRLLDTITSQTQRESIHMMSPPREMQATLQESARCSSRRAFSQ